MEMPRLLKKIGFFLFASSFVAGEKIDDAIKLAKKLEKKGIYSVINILGEHVKDSKEARWFCNEYCRLISKLFVEGLLNTHISIKPSQLGIEISLDLYRELLAKILGVAYLYLPNIKVEIDRETSEYAKVVQETSFLFAKIFPNHRLAGQINQSYAIEEIKEAIKIGLSYRLVKGTAYSSDINLKDEGKIRKIFYEQAISLAKRGNHCVAATHDPWLLEKLSKVMGIQVLLGIENNEHDNWFWWLLKKLVWIFGLKNDMAMKFAEEGGEVGIYIPCGPNWYPYGKRRWKSIVKIILRNWWYRLRRKNG